MDTCKIYNDKLVDNIVTVINKGLEKIREDNIYSKNLPKVEFEDVKNALIKLNKEEFNIGEVMDSLFKNEKFHLYKYNTDSSYKIDISTQEAIQEKINDSSTNVIFKESSLLMEIDYENNNIYINPNINKETFFSIYKQLNHVYFKFKKNKKYNFTINEYSFRNNIEFITFLALLGKELLNNNLPNSFSPIMQPFFKEESININSVSSYELNPDSSYYRELDFHNIFKVATEKASEIQKLSNTKRKNTETKINEYIRIDNAVKRIRQNFRININPNNIEAARLAHYILGFTDKIFPNASTNGFISEREIIDKDFQDELNLKENSLKGLLFISEGILNKHIPSNEERAKVDNEFGQFVANMGMLLDKFGNLVNPSYFKGELPIESDLNKLNSDREKNTFELNFLEDVNKYLRIVYSDLLPSSLEYFAILHSNITDLIYSNHSISLNDILFNYIEGARKFNSSLIVKRDNSSQEETVRSFRNDNKDTAIEEELLYTLIKDPNLPETEEGNITLGNLKPKKRNILRVYNETKGSNVRDKKEDTFYRLLEKSVFYNDESKAKDLRIGNFTVRDVLDNLINYFDNPNRDNYTPTDYFKARLLEKAKELNKNLLSTPIRVQDLNIELKEKHKKEKEKIEAKDIKLFVNEPRGSILLNYMIPSIMNRNDSGDLVNINFENILFQSILGQLVEENKIEDSDNYKQGVEFLSDINSSLSNYILNSYLNNGKTKEEAINLTQEDLSNINKSLKYKGLKDIETFYKELLSNESLQKLLMKLDATGNVKIKKEETGEQLSIFNKVKGYLNRAINKLFKTLFWKKSKSKEKTTAFDEALQLLSDFILYNNRDIVDSSNIIRDKKEKIKALDETKREIDKINALNKSSNNVTINSFLNIALLHVGNLDEESETRKRFEVILEDVILSTNDFSFLEGFLADIASKKLDTYLLTSSPSPFIEENGEFSADFIDGLMNIFYRENESGENLFDIFMEDLEEFAEESSNHYKGNIIQKKFVYRIEDIKGNTQIVSYPIINMRGKDIQNSFKKGYLIPQEPVDGNELYKIAFFDGSKSLYVTKDKYGHYLVTYLDKEGNLQIGNVLNNFFIPSEEGNALNTVLNELRKDFNNDSVIIKDTTDAVIETIIRVIDDWEKESISREEAIQSHTLEELKEETIASLTRAYGKKEYGKAMLKNIKGFFYYASNTVHLLEGFKLVTNKDILKLSDKDIDLEINESKEEINILNKTEEELEEKEEIGEDEDFLQNESSECTKEKWQIKQDTESVLDRVSRRVKKRLYLINSKEDNVLGRYKKYDYKETHNALINTLKYMASEDEMIPMLEYNIDKYPVFNNILLIIKQDPQFASELYKAYTMFSVDILKVQDYSIYETNYGGNKYVYNLTLQSRSRVLYSHWTEDMKVANTHESKTHLFKDAVTLDKNRYKVLYYNTLQKNNNEIRDIIENAKNTFLEAFENATLKAEKQNIANETIYSYKDSNGHIHTNKTLYDFLINQIDITLRAYGVRIPIRDLHKLFSFKYNNFLSKNSPQVDEIKDNSLATTFRIFAQRGKSATVDEVIKDLFSKIEKLNEDLDFVFESNLNKTISPQSFVDLSSYKQFLRKLNKTIIERIPTEGDSNVMVDNKSKYANRTDSYLGRVIKMFQRNNRDVLDSSYRIEKFRNFMYETYAKYKGTISVLGSKSDELSEMSFYSPLLNELVSENSEVARNLRYGNIASYSGKKWKDLERDDYENLGLALFFDGLTRGDKTGKDFAYYLMPVFGDAPELGSLRLERFASETRITKAEDSYTGKEILSYQNEIIERITQHAIAEVNEYFLFKRRARNKDKKFTIKNADKSNPDDVFFSKLPFLNKEENRKLIDSWEDILFPEIKEEEAPTDVIFSKLEQQVNTPNSILNKLKEIVTKEMDKNAEMFVDSFKTKVKKEEGNKDVKTFEIVDGYRVPFSIAGHLGIDKKYVHRETDMYNVKQSLMKFYYNDYYAQLEIFTLFGINPRLYKDYIDINKRIKEIYASGSRLSSFAKRKIPYLFNIKDGKVDVQKLRYKFNGTEIREEKTHRNVLLVKDFKAFSPIREKLIKKIEEKFDENSDDFLIEIRSLGLYNEVQEIKGKKYYFYKDKNGTLHEVEPMNLSDGQTILSMEESRRTQMYNGQEWTDEQEVAYQKYLMQVQINKANGMSNLEAHRDAHRHLDKSFKPIKTFGYSDAGIDTDDAYIPEFKNNTQVKHSEVTLPINSNTTQSEVLSAIAEVLNDYNEELREQGFDTIDAISFDSTIKAGATDAIDLNGLNGEEIKNLMIETAKSGKLRKISYSDFVVQQPTKEHFFDYKRQLIGSQLRRIMTADIADNTVFTIKGKKLNKKQFIEVLNSLLNHQIREDFQRVSETFKNNIKLAKRLRQSIISNDSFSDSLLDFLELDSNGNFKIPLFNPQNSIQFSNILTSIMRQEVNSMYIRGGKVVNATSIGYDETLVWHTDENGNPTYMDAIIPFPGTQEQYEKLMLSDGTIDMSKIDPKWLECVFYRVPTESDYSILPVKVKMFAPPSQSVSIILPVEALPVTGMDLDFDSMYGFVHNYEMIEDNGEYRIESIDSSDEILDRLITSISSKEEKFSKREKEELKEERKDYKNKENKKIEGIEINSNSNSELGKKLTNPSNNLGFEYKGKYYKNSEHAYQTWKSGSFDEVAYNKGDKIQKDNPSKRDVINPKSVVNKSQSFNIMKDILIAKFEAHPELIEEVKEAGGVSFLSKSTHNVINDSFWESKGQNKFIQALTEAYSGVAKEEDESSIEILEDEEDLEYSEVEELENDDATSTIDDILNDYNKEQRDNLFIDLVFGKLIDPASAKKRLKIGNFEQLKNFANKIYLMKEMGYTLARVNEMERKGELSKVKFDDKDPLEYKTRSYVFSINNVAVWNIKRFAMAIAFKNLMTSVGNIHLIPHKEIDGGFKSDELFLMNMLSNFLNIDYGKDISDKLNLSRINTLDRDGEPTNELCSETILEQLIGAVNATKFPTHSISRYYS